MSQDKEEQPKGNLGHQKKSNEEIDEIVNRLNTPKKKNEPKKPDRRTKIERRMTQAEIDVMVERLHSSAKPRERRLSAYEQQGVFGSYAATGWHTPGSGGKCYDVYRY